jgi:predicted phage terminase large subunit-like protein
VAYADRPTGDKISRADPYSVQVNEGVVLLVRAEWNAEFIDEHTFFPFSQYKDQVDAAAAAFSRLEEDKEVGAW